MQPDRDNMQGNADPKIVNKVDQRPGMEMLSEAGAANATHAGQQVDWKNSIAGDLRGPNT
jgi:hypothetical protein